MPPYKWPINPGPVIQSFDARRSNPEAGALFVWAVRTVESLHYLDDMDHAYNTSFKVIGGHSHEVLDIAHARWVTSTCITALDLCAAGLGRSFCGHTGQHELDLIDFAVRKSSLSSSTFFQAFRFCFRRRSNKQSGKRAARYKQLPTAAAQWVDAVFVDADYKRIKAARDWMVHSRLPLHYTIATGGPRVRLKLGKVGSELGVRHIVELARDVATRHVSAFVNLLPSI
jgi:hypothetical protein